MCGHVERPGWKCGYCAVTWNHISNTADLCSHACWMQQKRMKILSYPCIYCCNSA